MMQCTIIIIKRQHEHEGQKIFKQKSTSSYSLQKKEQNHMVFSRVILLDLKHFVILNRLFKKMNNTKVLKILRNFFAISETFQFYLLHTFFITLNENFQRKRETDLEPSTPLIQFSQAVTLLYRVVNFSQSHARRLISRESFLG